MHLGWRIPVRRPGVVADIARSVGIMDADFVGTTEKGWESMRRVKGISSSIGLMVAVSLYVADPAWAAGVAYAFDFGASPLSYVVGAGPGGKVGTITISEDSASVMALAKTDLVTNAILDWATNPEASTFDLRIVADVIKIASNDYVLQGTVKITDIGSDLSNPKVLADFVSNTVSIANGKIYLEGNLSVFGGNDALLLPSTSSSWVYAGDSSDTPNTPNEDGVVGQVTQASGRSLFTSGRAGGNGFTTAASLDAFFGANQGITSFSVQAHVVPEPVTSILVLAGLGWITRRRW